MAHLSDDSLPSEFDVIVEGTGLIESILAAALARCEKRVLHLDRNGFYGERWASLMHKEFHEWLQESEEHHELLPSTISNKSVLTVVQPSRGVYNFYQNVHGTDQKCPTPHLDEKSNSNSSDMSATDGNQSLLLSWSSLDQLKRRLVYDICPKVLACRGMMVDILTKSGCSRYVEFKAIDKICLYQSGKVEQVPCSRGDVFESKLVSMLEKRKMMKFLTFCASMDPDPELEKLTFVEYLRKADLTENLMQYVLLCIAMTDGGATALEGIQASKLFLKSLGRFDNAPFLYPIFGGGEMPQAFCRYCAVFGGVYCLRCSIKTLLISESAISAVTCSNHQEITCKAVVCNISTMKNTFGIDSSSTLRVKISRAILLVDGPMENTEGKQTMLTIPPFAAGPTQGHVVRVLQLDPSTKTAIEGTYMVHLMCESVEPQAKQDLEEVVRLLYNTQDDSECNKLGPRVLWSLYFNLDMHTVKQSDIRAAVNLPTNLYLTSDPDPTMTYENAIQEAKRIFNRLCPDQQFFEPPPELEDNV